MQNDGRVKIDAPLGVTDVLLHCCCAPCTGEIVEMLLGSDIKPILFFYNPNIYPEKEYELRKKAVVNFAVKKGLAFVDGDYDTDQWAKFVENFKDEPEGGKRCEKCFLMRLMCTAKYASQNRLKVIASTLGISRYKDFDKVTQCGKAAAQKYPGMIYWDYNWRKKGGSQRMYKIAKQEEFYAQDYCGCKFSLESRNKQKESKTK